MKSFFDLREKKEQKKDGDPCWKDYKQVGTKMKNGKEVPNCVPNESVQEAKSTGAADAMMAYAKKIGKTNNIDTRAFQVMAGKLANFEKTGNPGIVADMGKLLKSMDTDPRDMMIDIMMDHDPAMAKSVMRKAGFSVKESVEESVTPGDLKAQGEGKKAARKGVKYSENPYEKGSSRHLQWSKGHNAARASKLGMREEVELDENKLLKVSKLSSAEYQKAKKLKGFDKSNYTWNSSDQLYHKKDVKEEVGQIDIEEALTAKQRRDIEDHQDRLRTKKAEKDAKATKNFKHVRGTYGTKDIDEKLETDGPNKKNNLDNWGKYLSKTGSKYLKKKAGERSDMNKKNDPGADKKGLALTVLDREKAMSKANKKMDKRILNKEEVELEEVYKVGQAVYAQVGKFEVKAKVVKVKGDKVTIEDDEGQMDVSIHQLSPRKLIRGRD